MLIIVLHEAMFNDGLSTYFWIHASDVMMNVHTFDDHVTEQILVALEDLRGTLIFRF